MSYEDKISIPEEKPRTLTGIKVVDLVQVINSQPGERRIVPLHSSPEEASAARLALMKKIRANSDARRGVGLPPQELS